VFTSHKPLFDTMQFWKDNAIACHRIHGLYRLWAVDIPCGLLHMGKKIGFLFPTCYFQVIVMVAYWVGVEC
jgi:rhamnogalacturonan endolyase